jgi:hypothetical protein
MTKSIVPSFYKRTSTFALVSILFLTSCGVLKKKEPDPTLDFLKKPLTQEQSQKLTGEVGGNFLYGQGFGDFLINIGGILITPWYALYVLGNAAISVADYEPLYITNLLPNKTKSGYDAVYKTVASGPGRGAALIGNEPYRTEEIIKERYRKLLNN